MERYLSYAWGKDRLNPVKRTPTVIYGITTPEHKGGGKAPGTEPLTPPVLEKLRNLADADALLLCCVTQADDSSLNTES